ncbi:MAG: hypothetical protein Q9184_003358 [Pyrenodesmia sp. 2 TL-2023]
MDKFARHAPTYSSICQQCRTRLLPTRAFLRLFSTSPRNAAEPPIPIPEPSTPSQPEPKLPSFLSSIRSSQTNNAFTNFDPKPESPFGSSVESIYEHARYGRTSTVAASTWSISDAPVLPEPHHLHVYSTKHNTHITLTKPDRNPIISVSSGTIGFRKAARGTYDAGYQLGAYVMGRIQQQGLLTQIQALEVVLRDFGPGREAITKILLGSEGKNLRGRVVRVCDATRLKFGGTRSKKARRL